MSQSRKWRLSRHRDAIVIDIAPVDEECFDEFRVMSVTSNEDLYFRDDETERMILWAPELAALLREMVDHGENVRLHLRAESLLEFIRTGNR